MQRTEKQIKNDIRKVNLLINRYSMSNNSKDKKLAEQYKQDLVKFKRELKELQISELQELHN